MKLDSEFNLDTKLYTLNIELVTICNKTNSIDFYNTTFVNYSSKVLKSGVFNRIGMLKDKE